VLASHEHVPVVVSQTLLAHAVQPAPPVPHWAADCEEYATHVLPLQQPFGHDWASQTHCPLVVLHACPDGQAMHATPPEPHVELVSDP
jgi:hypothetical protein